MPNEKKTTATLYAVAFEGGQLDQDIGKLIWRAALPSLFPCPQEFGKRHLYNMSVRHPDIKKLAPIRA